MATYSKTLNTAANIKNIQYSSTKDFYWGSGKQAGVLQGSTSSYKTGAYVSNLHFSDLNSIDWNSKNITSITFNYTCSYQTQNLKHFGFYECTTLTEKPTAAPGSTFLGNFLGYVTNSGNKETHTFTFSSSSNSSLFNNFVSYLKKGPQNITMYWPDYTTNKNGLYCLSSITLTINYEEGGIAYYYSGGTWVPCHLFYYSGGWQQVGSWEKL